MPESSSLNFHQTIDMPASAVYYALTNQSAVSQWLCSNALVTAIEGGSYFFNWNRPRYYAMGEFTKLNSDKELQFTWLGKNEPAQTKVTITLTEDESSTRLDLTHSDLGSGEDWADTRRQVDRGWTYSLENLKQVLEKGFDRRVYDRPFLGVLIASVISEEEAQQWDKDLKGGIRISGTLESTGAVDAGLEPQDVIVRLGEIDTKDFPALQKFIRDHHVGDTVEAEYVRNGKLHTTKMILSPRPAPHVPADTEGLAKEMAKIHQQINQELDGIVSGLDEATFEYKPDATKWSAKELLAHLLTNERTFQIWVSSMVDNQYLRGWPNNPQALIDSVANTTSMTNLIEAFKHSENETVELLSQLPEDTVSRKSTYNLIAENALILFPSHTHSHLIEMKEAIEVAQAK